MKRVFTNKFAKEDEIAKEYATKFYNDYKKILELHPDDEDFKDTNYTEAEFQRAIRNILVMPEDLLLEFYKRLKERSQGLYLTCALWLYAEILQGNLTTIGDRMYYMHLSTKMSMFKELLNV